MVDENESLNVPVTPALKRKAEREARVAAKLRENLRRRKQAARKQKTATKPDG